jgi:hypothetical protein
VYDVPAGSQAASTVRTWPRRGVPLMTGRRVLTGAPEVIGPTAAEVALATPYGFVAVTATRSFAPMSGTPGV